MPCPLPAAHGMRDVQMADRLHSYREIEPNPRPGRMNNAMTALERVEIPSSERPERMRYDDRKGQILDRPRRRGARDGYDTKALDVGSYQTGRAKLPVKIRLHRACLDCKTDERYLSVHKTQGWRLKTVNSGFLRHPRLRVDISRYVNRTIRMQKPFHRASSYLISTQSM